MGQLERVQTEIFASLNKLKIEDKLNAQGVESCLPWPQIEVKYAATLTLVLGSPDDSNPTA